MTKIKLWILGSVAIILILIGGGWLLGIAPQLAIASKANQDRATAISYNNQNQLLLTKLRIDYLNIDAFKKQLDMLRLSVPTSANIASFISELNLAANRNNVVIKSIQLSDAKPYTPIEPPPSATGAAGASTPLINSKITPANFVVIPLQFLVTGSYNQVLKFIKVVQSGQRLFLVATFSSGGSTVTPSLKVNPSLPANFSASVEASIGGYIYVLLE